jgi:rare lipoprotein A
MSPRGAARRPVIEIAQRALPIAALLALACHLAFAAPAGGQAPETGIASWYGPGFHGKRTSSGEAYDEEKLTAAHRTLPFGTYLRVRSLDNGSSVVVRVNDRGPFAEGRVIDLSEAAARILGMIPTGTARVSLAAIPEDEALAWKGGSIDGSPEAGRGTELPAPAPPVPSNARVRIQVASYASEANAEATLERLALSGLTARIEAAGGRFRVAFADLSPEESRLVSMKLEGLGYRGFTITSIKPAAFP